jgi:hypothetical protein
VIDQAAQEALIPVEIELSADEFDAVERYVAEMDAEQVAP